MKELLMHISREPGRYLDVLDSGKKRLVAREPAEKVVSKLEHLLAQHGNLLVVSFRRVQNLDVDRQEFPLSQDSKSQAESKQNEQNSPTSITQPEEKKMSDPAINTTLILLQNENKWLKDSHDKLERENGDLRVSNEKLRIENNELSVKTATHEKEKELALKHQEVSQKKGLGAIGTPEEIKDMIGGIAELVRSFKGENPPANGQMGTLPPGMSSIKQEVLQYLSSQVGGISDEQAQKLAFLVKTIVENQKIEYMFDQWTANSNQPSA